MPVVRRLLLAAVVTALAVGSGVALQDSDSSRGPVKATNTPLTSFDTRGVKILRTEFCDRVPDASVEAALGAEPSDSAAYGNGDRVQLAPGVRDLAHEYGCSWTTDGVTAAAWVYAPPVPRAAAYGLLRGAREGDTCERVPEAPAYGQPSEALVCTTKRGLEVSFRGLFGDAWLSCSIRTTRVSAGESNERAVDRTGRWCVAVARAASADEI
jgi:hypothetical protein